MTTYYYGDVEFGTFGAGVTRTPMAIIHTIKDVKQFDDPQDAWDYYVNSNGEFESYISEEGTNEFDETYEIVFKGR